MIVPLLLNTKEFRGLPILSITQTVQNINDALLQSNQAQSKIKNIKEYSIPGVPRS